MTGENTVIKSYGESYAPAWLQYYLIKCVAKHAEAMAYSCYRPKGAPRPDRQAAPVFPIVRNSVAVASDKLVIVVGTLKHLPSAYLTDDDRRFLESRRGSVLVKRRGNVVLLAKNSVDHWAFGHITTFLDKVCGVRLYAPSDPGQNAEELWLSMPPGDAVQIGRLAIKVRPYFTKASWGFVERNREWMRMNGSIVEGSKVRATHGIINYFKPEKYYAKYPQLYPMGKDGNRPQPVANYWNPCLADPDLASRIAMDEIRAQMKTKAKDYFSFGVMDTRYRCNCPPCSASLEENNGNAANLWYTFLNKVAKACQKEFPGLYLSSYNYSNVGIPTGIRIESNIVVDNVIKSYQVVDPVMFEGMKNEILAMASTGASWVTHDWDFSGVTPRIYSRQYAAFLQWGAQNGLLGALTEWSKLEYWYLAGAKYWVSRQLLTNPYQDVDGLWLQYCEDMYGPAWEEMYRFYDSFAQKHVASSHFHVRQDWPREEAAAYTAADVAAQRVLLETAMSRSRHRPLIQRRLALVMRYFRAHELLVQATSVPARAYHRYTRLEGKTGVNKEALAFYANDDGKKLIAFDTYYDTKRTLPPDSNAEDKNSSMRFSYRNNYSRALGTIIEAVNAEAMAGIDANTATAKDVQAVARRARQIFRHNLPKRYDRSRVRELEKLLEKFIFVPRQAVLPTFDGDLSETAWKGAVRLDGWTLADLLTPSAIGNETSGKMMRVGDRIVFGIVCKQPRGIWAETPADRFTGSSIFREASCEFLLGPVAAPGEKPSYFQYVVNALGSFRGYRSSADNRKDVSCAVKWDREARTYTIEAAFPLKVDGMYDYSQAKAFSFNIMQNPFEGDTFNSPERIGWSPIFYTAHLPQSRALIVIE
jgi:hypothetical protein